MIQKINGEELKKKKNIRRFFLTITVLITVLSICQIVDMLPLAIMFLRDIPHYVFEVSLVFLVLLISITGILSIKYNWSLLKSKSVLENLSLIDDFGPITQNPSKTLNIFYKLFSLLLIVFGVFIGSRLPSSKMYEYHMPQYVIAWGIVVLLIGLGVLFFRDSQTGTK